MHYWIKNDKVRLLSLQIAPAQIAFFKFILEGYDGLASLTTVDARTGRVVVVIPPGRSGELQALLQHLEKEIFMEPDATPLSDFPGLFPSET